MPLCNATVFDGLICIVGEVRRLTPNGVKNDGLSLFLQALLYNVT